MGNLDMEKLRSRLKSLQKNSNKSNLIWKPTEKEQTIRIVPYKYQPGVPFIELYFHYGLDGKTYLSPISFGKPDPISELADELKNSGDTENWRMGKDLEPKLRTFAAIIVRGKEHEGIKFWGFGKTIYEYFLSNIDNPKCGDITDIKEGRDVTVWAVKEAGKKFLTPKVNIDFDKSPIVDPTRSDAKELINKIAKEQTDIKELWEMKSYEELTEILKKHLEPEKAEEERNENSDFSQQADEPEKQESQEKSDFSNETDEKQIPSSVDDAYDEFNRLFEED